MSEPTFYGYKGCGTCRKAMAFLDQAGRAYTFVDITTDPPPRATLAALLEGDYELKHLYNTSGQAYREGKVGERRKTLSQDAQLDLLAGNGRLIKRPIVVDGARATVGFDAETFARVWG
ncbi:MAG: arsenate reductase family protein [Planctomycetota bacterium]